MILVPGGTYAMGSDAFYPEEAPCRTVSVDAFLLDPNPVTNAEYRRFVDETGYRTVAEAAPTGPVSRAFQVQRYDFVVQFCWQPKTRAERREMAAKRLAAEAEAAAAKEAADAAAAEQPPAQ